MPKSTPDPSTTANSDVRDLSYEQAMEQLESIVAAMDNDRLPLEEMIDSYERGTQLLKICQQRLQAAQHRMETIQAAKNGATLSPETPPASPLSPNQSATAHSTTSPAKARRVAAKAPETDDDNEISLF